MGKHRKPKEWKKSYPKDGNPPKGAPLNKAGHKLDKGSDINQSEEKRPPLANSSSKLSKDFEILGTRTEGDLTIGCININRIGKVKKAEIQQMMQELGIDCLGIIEHKLKGYNNTDPNEQTIINHPSLKMKGFKSASRHRDTDSGGVAWIWKQDLNVVAWEGAELENHLKDHSNERCWIKIKSSSGTIALAAAYLPVEGSNETGREKFGKILQILDKDTNTLEQEKSSYYIYGDFNAHIGTPANDPLGIKGNKPKVGENGQDLVEK